MKQRDEADPLSGRNSKSELRPKTNQGISGIILDLDGTIFRGDQLIPGADEAINNLRRRGFPLVFTTNALESPVEQAARLKSAGITATPDEIITAPQLLKAYLLEKMRDASIYVISDPPLSERLGLNFHISEDPEEIDAVIVSCDRTFNFDKLNIGFQALRRGARFFAVNTDATCRLEDGELPDAGAVIGALEGCSKRKLDIVFGKPSPLVVEAALKHLELPAEECLIVGDNLESDILMGQCAGMTTALVLTGVTRREHLSRSKITPDYILESVIGILDILLAPNS